MKHVSLLVFRHVFSYATFLLVGWGMAAFTVPAHAQGRASEGSSARDLFGEVVDIGVGHADLEKAIKTFETGNLAEARKQLTAAFEAHPELPPPDTMLAQMLFGRQMVGEGLVALEKSIKEKSTDPEAYVFMAEYCLSQRLFTAAESLANQSTDMIKKYQANPKRKVNLQLRVINVLSAALESREEWAKAAGYLQLWLKTGTDTASAFKPKPEAIASMYYRQGNALYQAGKLTEAEAAFAAAKKISPDTTDLPALSMAMLATSKKDSKVDEYFARVAKEGENDLNSQINLASRSLDLGKIDEAKKHTDKAASIKPSSLEAKIMRGIVARARGDLTAAEALFKEAHLLSPRDFTATNQLALVLIDQPAPEQQARGLALAEMNGQLNPNLPEAAATLGWVYHRSGSTEKGFNLLNGAYRSGNLSADGHYYFARLLDDVMKQDDAKRVLGDLRRKVSFPLRKDLQALADRLQVKVDVNSQENNAADTAAPTTVTPPIVGGSSAAAPATPAGAK